MKLIPGYYKTSGVIQFDQFGTVLEGDNPIACKIFADHVDGPVVRLTRTRSGVKGVDLSATNDRKNFEGTVAEHIPLTGLYMRGTGSGTAAILAHCEVDNVLMSYQPGLALVSNAAGSRFTRFEARECKAGGFAWDTGRLFAQTLDDTIVDPETGLTAREAWLEQLDFVGWNYIDTFRAKDCGGYAMAIGHPEDRAGQLMYRFQISNGDLGNNANDGDWLVGETFLYKDHLGNPIEAQSFINGNGIIIENCGLGGGQNGAPTRSLVVGGGSIHIRNNRFPSSSQCVWVDEFRYIDPDDGVTVRTGLPTRGVTIERMHCVDGIGTADPGSGTIDYAVGIAPHVNESAVNIVQERTGEIDQIVDGQAASYQFGREWYYNGPVTIDNDLTVASDLVLTTGAVIGDVSVTGGLTATESITAPGFTAGINVQIQDDKYAKITFSTTSPWGFLRLAGASSAAPAFGFAFRAGTTNGYNQRAFRGSTAVDVGTFNTVPTGTTGVDGNITVTAATDGCVYIENRSGGTITYSLSFGAASSLQYITTTEILPA